MTIKARKPTGVVPYPFLLVEGEEKAGKTWAAAILSRSARVGQTYWLDLGEGSGDEYGAIPGTRYLVLEHDGSYAQVLEQIVAVKAEAQRAKDAGEPPVVLVIDTLTDLWDGLKNWTSERARGSRANQRKLAEDPNAELQVSMNLWNDAAARYRKLATQLLTFPGIVVATARGKSVAQLDDSGRPVEGQKAYKVEGHKTLPFDATLWLRMFRDAPPVVVGARSVHAGVRPGEDKPQPITDRHDDLLDWLIFDVLKCDASAAHVRDLNHVTGGDLTPEEALQDSPPPTRGVPAEDQWAKPIVTDGEWLKGWKKKLNGADRPALVLLWNDLGDHVKNLTISPEDKAEAENLWKARRTVLDHKDAEAARSNAKEPEA